MIHRTILAASMAMLATPALAHIGVHDTSTFADGAMHPLTGLDHIAVMLAVGLWAALKGGKALVAWPLAFVAAMIAGCIIGQQVSLPGIEPAILASVVALGLLVALAIDLPVWLGAIVIGAFAVFHGAAHGAEAIGESGAAYIAGFASTTAMLHLAGLGAGYALRSAKLQPLLRGAGALCAVIGLALAAQAL